MLRHRGGVGLGVEAEHELTPGARAEVEAGLPEELAGAVALRAREVVVVADLAPDGTGQHGENGHHGDPSGDDGVPEALTGRCEAFHDVLLLGLDDVTRGR